MVLPGFACAQSTPQAFPIISSTVNGPYDVLRPVFAILPISAGLLSNDPYEPMHEAMNKGFKSIEEFAKKNGGDAVVNTSIQVLMYTAIRPNGVMGQIVFYGTLIKQRPEAK
jgi:hypothetical protein